MTRVPPAGDGPTSDEPPAALPGAEGAPEDAFGGSPARSAREPATATASEDAFGASPERSAREPATPTAPARRGADAWLPWSAPLALLLWFGLTLVASIVVAIAAAAMGSSLDDPPPGVNIAGTFAQDVAMIAAALTFAFLASRPRAPDFGLVRTAVGRAVGAMFAVWIGFVAFSLLWRSLVSLDEPQTLPDDLGIEGSTVRLVLVVAIITVLAPVAEELLFRGYVFRALRNWRGVVPAAIISGLAFGAVHIGSSPVGYALPLAAFGFGLCILYEWTGSLHPCIALHALNNAFALGLDRGWGWEIPALMVGACALSLALATALGRAVDRSADRAPAAAPAPAG